MGNTFHFPLFHLFYDKLFVKNVEMKSDANSCCAWHENIFMFQFYLYKRA